jgi:flagellin-like protein
MWTERARSWRKKGKQRAVSPIIATILLVAITVVLAAVLYILISGLTRGPGNTPIGTAFGFGTPTLSQGAALATFPPCKAADYCYAIGIASSSTGVTAANIQFQVQTSSGTVYSIAGAGGASIVDIGGAVVVKAAVVAGPYSVTTWTAGGGAYTSTTTQLQTSMTIWVDLGTANPTGQGLVLVALGTGSYSGQTQVNLP